MRYGLGSNARVNGSFEKKNHLIVNGTIHHQMKYFKSCN